MNTHARLIAHKMASLADLYPCTLVTGARQTGKTTLVRSFFPHHTWCLLDNLSLLEQADKDPALFLQNNPPPIIVDEAQRAKNLFMAIKGFVDQKNPGGGSFILSGSQPLQLMEAVSESLAGRIGLVSLLPMGLAEIVQNSDRIEILNVMNNPPIGDQASITRSLADLVFRGGFPGIGLPEHSKDDFAVAHKLSDYVGTYLTKDLREISHVKDLSRFERFLRLLSTASATVPNIRELSANGGIPQATAENWLSILKASMLVYEIPGFSSSHKKRETKRPKLYLCDSGLHASLLGYSSSQQVERSPYTGSIFETFAFQSIKANLEASLASYNLYHWRSAERDEVDLIIEQGAGNLLAVEIKRTAKPIKDDTQGIKSLMRATKACKSGILITAHEQCFWLEPDILHLPLWMI